MFGRRRRGAHADAATIVDGEAVRTVRLVGTGPHAEAWLAALGSDAGRWRWRVVSGTETAMVDVLVEPPDVATLDLPAALRSLGTGRALVIQAPWRVDADQLDALVGAQRATGVPVVYAEPLCHAPVVRELRRRVGAAGAIERIESRQFGPERLGDAPFAAAIALALVTARAGGAGPITDVVRLDPGPGTPPDHHASAPRRVRLRFADGAVADVRSDRSDTRAGDLQASGATWVVRADLFPVPTVEHDGEPVPVDEPVTTPVELGRYGHLGLLDELGLALVGSSPPSTDAAFGAEVARVLRTVVGPSR